MLEREINLTGRADYLCWDRLNFERSKLLTDPDETAQN